MIVPGIAATLGVAAGALLGRRLAARGLTAQNALVGRQKQAYIVLGVVAAVLGLIYFGSETPLLRLLPDAFVIYGEELASPAIIALAAAAAGLLIGLEWRGGKGMIGTSGFASVLLLAALGFLLSRTRPILGMVRDSVVHDGVVFQTTAHSCAPASIATLARLTGIDTTLTERAVITMARTTREGTSALGEMQAMRALGMEPRYARFLTPESLAVVGRPAVLHVDEPVGTTTIRHAVALIAVDPVRRTILIGNPLHGRQVRGYDEMRGYWTGEALFVMRPAS